MKKKILNYKTYHQLLESNVLDTYKTRNELFEGMKKGCSLSRFVEIMDKLKRRKESEINKARDLPEIWYQQRLGRKTASNFYRISSKTKSLQNNVNNNAESSLKNLTESNKFESKPTKHGTAMESHAKLQVMSILKKSHKNFTSANPGLKVDQIY